MRPLCNTCHKDYCICQHDPSKMGFYQTEYTYLSSSSVMEESIFIPYRMDNYNDYFIPSKPNKDALEGCGCGCNGDWMSTGTWTIIEQSDVVTAHTFKDGMTVKDLKSLIKFWPDEYEDGTPTEVWLESGKGHSTQARSAWPLNKCDDRADLIIECEK